MNYSAYIYKHGVHGNEYDVMPVGTYRTLTRAKQAALRAARPESTLLVIANDLNKWEKRVWECLRDRRWRKAPPVSAEKAIGIELSAALRRAQKGENET